MLRRWCIGLAGAAVATAGLATVPVHAAQPPFGSHRALRPAAVARAPIGPVTVGRVTPTGTSSCADDVLWMQSGAAPGQTSSTVPYAGVVTSLRHFANASPHAQIQAVFMRPNATPNSYVIAVRSPVVTVTPAQLNTIPVRLPVAAGDILALRSVSGAPRCSESGAPADLEDIGNLLDSGTTWSPIVTNGPQQIVDLAAVLEPDGDGDGYGDASQDGCPALAAVHDPCPAPVTTITKRPKKRSPQHKVTITFVPSIAGSTYGCSIDGRAFKPCHSPFKHRFRPGTHTVRVQAISPVGVAGDPVTVKFKVVKARR